MSETKDNLNINIKIKFKEEDFMSNTDVLRTKVVVPMVNPTKLTLGSEIFTIASNPATEQVVAKTVGGNVKAMIPIEALTNLKYVAIERHPITGLSLSDDKNTVIANGEVHLPINGASTRNEVREVFFSNYDDAKEVCRIITKVELAKAKQMLYEVEQVTNMLQKQQDADLF